MAFERHICCWHILCNSMVNKLSILLICYGCVQKYGLHMQTTVEVQWDICVQYGKYICSWTFVGNVKCMYPGYSIDCIEFLWGIYTDKVASHVHMK